MFSFWYDPVAYWERYSRVRCEKGRTKPNVDTVFSLAALLSALGYTSTAAGLHFCDF